MEKLLSLLEMSFQTDKFDYKKVGDEGAELIGCGGDSQTLRLGANHPRPASEIFVHLSGRESLENISLNRNFGI